jgi:glycosyltransferase involved in cell wall biosynthesis
VRIVHLAAYGAPYSGSFIPMLIATMRAAQARGWRFEAVFAPVVGDRPWMAELAAAGMPLTFSASGSRRVVGRWLAQWLGHAESPIVLHSHFAKYDIPIVLAARGRTATTLFWHVHNTLHDRPLAHLRDTLKFAIAGRRVSGILCVAPDVLDDVRRRLAPASRTTLFENAIDTDRFVPAAAAQRHRARERLGIPADARVLMHFGWDWERKGGDLLIAALALLHARGVGAGGGGDVRAGTDPVAVLVGGGAWARAAARELEPSSVRIVEPTDDVRSLYAAADLLICPSRAEGMPFSLAEALASGVSVVASDLPGHAAIGGGLPSCRLTPLAARPIADAVDLLLARAPEQVALDAEESRRGIRERMDLSRWAERLLDLYERALSAGRNARAS